MYQRSYDTDWRRLSRREMIERSFALGVSDGLERAYREEYDRVRALSGNAYDRRFVDLAYEEGRARAMHLRPRRGDDEEVWRELVEDANVYGRAAVEEFLPPALARPETLELQDGRPSILDLPEFLSRK